MLLREVINSKRKGPTIFPCRQYQHNVNARYDEQRIIFEQINIERPSFYSEGYTTAIFMLEANNQAIEFSKEDDQETETLVKENQVVIINKNQVNKKLVKDVKGDKSFVFNWENLQEDNFFKIINNSSIALYRIHGVKGGNIMFHEKIQSLALMDLISASKQAKLLSNEAYLQLMEIDRHNKNMPDCIIHLNNKLKITVQLKCRDIEIYGFPTENWMVTLFKDYKNTGLTALIIDKKYINLFISRFKDLMIVNKEDNIIIMTVDDGSMQKNLYGISLMIFEQVNRQNKSNKYSDIEYQNVNFENEFINSNTQNKKDDSTLDDLSKENYDNGKNKMELAQKIKDRYVKLESPKTLFDLDLYASRRQAQILIDNGMSLDASSFFMGQAMGLFSDK
jgi:hypothetical protein